MDGRETVHVISSCRFELSTPANKKYKEEKLHEIIIAICAMLNSNGGNVVLHNECDCEKCKSSQMSIVVRILEQSMISILGLNQTVSNINFKVDAEKTRILVKKSDCLITTNYNLCLPSQSHVVQVSPLEPLEKVKHDIINRKIVREPVQLGSHCTRFVKYNNSGVQECKTDQLKLLKASPSKRTTLADRITSQSNKFDCYVSAFANYSGGHIYYGIRDDGVVEGELISTEKDISEITKKVGKAINKMIWPEEIGQPKRGVHWEIFFEPVIDENSKPIPSTFVIVIYIAACAGGVFTEGPECYEMVQGKVEKMSFTTWMKRILEPVQIISIPHEICSSITWISKKTKKLCTKAFCILTICLNNGDLKAFQDKSKKLRKMFPDIIELDLVLLLKKIIARFRQQHYTTADKLLDVYDKRLSNATEHRMFQVLGLCLRVAVARRKRDLNCIRNLLIFALAKAEWLSPGLVTALVYFCAGTMTAVGPVDTFSPVFLRPDEFTMKALQHIQVTSDCPEVRADLEYKAHITLAMFYLGCNISGELVAEHVDDNCLKKARSSVIAINRDRGNLTYYREVQLNLVESIYSFRCSENQPEERMHFMQEAFEYSKNSEKLAQKWKFYEMVSWSKSLQSLYVEKLLRAKIAQIKKDRADYVPTIETV